MFGWVIVAASYRSQGSALQLNRIAAYMFRTEQLLAGLIRMFGFQIDIRQDEFARADWRMVTVGIVNSIQAVTGYAVLSDPDMESRLLFCVTDGVFILILGALSKSAPQSRCNCPH